MDLKVVDYQVVEADFEGGVPTQFNSNFHTADEAADLDIPSNAPTSYSRWLPLVMRSRRLPADTLQTVSLSSVQVRLLVQAAAASIHTRRLNLAYAEDLGDEVGPAFSPLTFPPQGLFMRLGACSAKDGEPKIPGRASVSSVDEIILQLTTSARVQSALSSSLRAGAPSVDIFFLPFDEQMDTQREYRVFCMPETLRITAVSQYRWHKPWLFAGQSETKTAAVAQSIWKGIAAVHADIVEDLRPLEDGMDVLLRRQGLTFDVLFDERDGRCQLIELNTFGVRSACGSCLFHWLRDRDLMYGKLSDVVEFRVTF